MKQRRAPSARRWLPAGVLGFGLASLLMLVTVDRLSDQWASRDLNLLHALADVQNAVTAVHLWLQEYGTGDAERGDELWQDLEAAQDMSHALVSGGDPGRFSESPIVPPQDPELLDRFRRLELLVDRFLILSSMRRDFFEDGVSAGDPRSTDTGYDRVFAEFDHSATMLQIDLADNIRSNKRRSRVLIGALLAAWLLVIVLASAALWRYEGYRARAEAVLKEREGQLLQAQKMEAVGRLAGGLAHDINNYLAAIRGQCELVKMKAADEGVARRMDLVLSTADRASSLIERLLAFSRRQPVQPRLVLLNDVVDDLEPMLERLIGDVKLTTGLCGQDCAVEIDPSQVEQVIVNLLINAREAMPAGGEVELTTDCRHFDEADPDRPPLLEAGDYVELAVRDEGTGIPPEIRDKIFEPFFTTKQEASGLGLPTVYGIAQQQGGIVSVDSTPGRGTTFRVFLPRRTAAPAADRPIEHPAADLAAPEGQGERLLVVDDHDAFRESLQGLLEGLGYEVEVTANAADAETLYARRAQEGQDNGGSLGRHGFDLVITDVVMPGGDGRQLVDRLRRRHGALRTLFVSGYTGDVALRHGVGGESVELLHKPFSAHDLACKVRELLDRPPPDLTPREGVVPLRAVG